MINFKNSLNTKKNSLVTKESYLFQESELKYSKWNNVIDNKFKCSIITHAIAYIIAILVKSDNIHKHLNENIAYIIYI